jgi:hypothetical protein
MNNWKSQVQDYVNADKANWSLNNPDHAWIGPHVAEIALSEYEKLESDLQDARAKIAGLEEEIRCLKLPKKNEISIPKRYYIREEGETTQESIEAHCDDGFDSWERARDQANQNVDFGSKWDIVDRNGTVYASGACPLPEDV